MRAEPLLFDAHPGLVARVPWLPLASLPTPVESCEAIADWLGRDGVFMKRDELASPLYGGNKVRRYEYLLAEAKARGATRLVTVGGLASTQAMATALFGRAHGFDVTLVLFDQPLTPFARASVRGFVAAGANVVYGGGYVRTAFKSVQAAREPGSYLILPGAASPLANLGYVDAMMELARQVDDGACPRPDLIVVPSGSAGTLAGLALGAAQLGWRTEVCGVRITTALACNRLTVAALVHATDRFLAARAPTWKRCKVHTSIYGGALGRGYGYPTAAALEGAQQFERLTGAPGEITYSGKALAALRTLGQLDRYRGKTILLWNTLSAVQPTDPGARLPAELTWIDAAPDVQID